MPSVPYSISFNNYSLQSASYRTRTMQHTNQPNKFVQMESRARADGFNIVNVRYQTRTIEVEGMLSAADRASLVALIDTMKLNLNGVSGNLDIAYGNETRRYFATVQSLDLPEDFYNITSVPYKIIFVCADPFGYPTSSGIASIPGVTTMLKDLVVTVSGSINSDPVLFVTINSGTVGMNLVTFSNELTGEVIIISKPNAAVFNQGDILIINSRTKQVQINGSGLDYTGRFPTMNPPSAQLRVAIQGSQVNYDLVVRYLPAYL